MLQLQEILWEVFRMGIEMCLLFYGLTIKKRLIAIKMSHDRKHVDHHYCSKTLLLWLYWMLPTAELWIIHHCWFSTPSSNFCQIVERSVEWLEKYNTRNLFVKGAILATVFSHQTQSSTEESEKHLVYLLGWVMST